MTMPGNDELKRAYPREVPRWALFEFRLDGPSSGNPFVEIELGARFESEGRVADVSGFYDGEGRYAIRFMPEREGAWTFRTRSNRAELDGREGSFSCVSPLSGNHGPVRVTDRFHFAYADGSRYMPFGTTCYAWTHQGAARPISTRATSSGGPRAGYCGARAPRA